MGVVAIRGQPEVRPADHRASTSPVRPRADRLTDGRLRDFAELDRYEFATWCGGEATRWGGDTVMPYAANVTVEVSGVCVTPGDYAYADRTGGVIIPAGSVHRVLDEAESIERDDSGFRERIRNEDPEVDLGGATRTAEV